MAEDRGTGESTLSGPPLHQGGSSWAIGGGSLSLGHPLVVGILNLTPDSFSDGGSLPDVDAALRAAREMVDQGARLLDVGGESTRPGAIHAHGVPDTSERCSRPNHRAIQRTCA